MKQILCLLALICSLLHYKIESNLRMNTKQFEIIRATPQEIDYVDDKLGEYNNEQVPFTQKENPILKNYIIKDKGEIIAGIKADIYHWGILYLEVFWVDKRYRGKGLGSALLNRVEQEAKEVGATLVHTDTFDFQAKDFYLKHGYQIFGVLEDCPPGHNRYYLKKKL